jgi:putative hydrolase of the HAD superfamily
MNKMRKREGLMIKNIIFDIGQVLARFRWREYIEDFGYSKEVAERLGKATVLSPYWNEVDRGVKTAQEIVELCVSYDKGIEQEIRKFYENTSKLVVEFDYSYDWVKELKDQGLKIYLLSNYGEGNFAHIKDVFRFFALIDGAVISYQEKCIKPEEKIYRTLLDRYELNPDECVFIDDLAPNIEGAKKLGIHGIQFLELDQVKEELKTYLEKE